MKLSEFTGILACVALTVVAADAKTWARPYPVPDEELSFHETPHEPAHIIEARRKSLGAKLDGGHRSTDHLYIAERTSRESLPKGFVAGWDDWEDCQDTIAYIKDQAGCGSCWAVAASQVVAHRTCIACGEKCSHRLDGADPLVLLNENRPCMDMSAEQILSCCNWCGSGCQGGYPIDAMMYWSRVGVVSGGWYGSRCGCQPYAIPPFSRVPGESPVGGSTPQCARSCEAGYPKTMAQDKHMAKAHRKVVGEQAMMEEIYHHGSIECAFSVYSNFMHYKNGIYDHKAGYLDGGHAITVIGWGELSNGRKYWVINNSWNTTWGAGGRFFWEKGTNLLGMEEGCVAATPTCNNKDNELHCLH